MHTLQNDLYLRALAREKVERTPAWMMRQAGRYLPEYMATRKQAGDFMSLCKNKNLACEVTLQPLDRYNLDAAILFSDILTIPDAMGLGLHFETGEGPVFKYPITREDDIEILPILDPHDDLQYVMDAVYEISQALKGKVPLIGFSGSPWTLATYMIEGKSSKNFSKIKKMMYQDPQLLHRLLDLLAINVTNYLNCQIEVGAQAIMLFDTWGGMLGHREYQEFSLQYMTKIISKLTKVARGRKVPVTVYTKGGGLWLETIAKSGCDCIGVDWTINIGDARRRLQASKVSIQGNMDPSVLYGSPDTIRNYVKQIVTDYSCGHTLGTSDFNRGHIFNLGHGILTDIDPHNPQIMLDALHELTLGVEKSMLYIE